MAGGERPAAEFRRETFGIVPIPQSQIEQRRRCHACRNRFGASAPARRDLRRQGRHGRQGSMPTHQCAEHPMRQPARAACQQWQAGADDGVGRGIEPQPLRQHQAQHHAGLGIGGQILAPHFAEQKMFGVAQALERSLGDEAHR